MLQAVQVETQAEQGLAHLRGQAAAWSPYRELAFNRREDTLEQSTTSMLRDRSPHFGTHAAHASSFLPALGGDHTLGSKFLPNVGVISLAFEFSIRQHQPDAGLLGSGFRPLRAHSRNRSIRGCWHENGKRFRNAWNGPFEARETFPLTF